VKLFNKKEKSGGIPYIVNDDGSYEYLFMIPSNPKFGGIYPQIAKGIIDKDETSKEACLREVKEELGVVSCETIFHLFNTKFKRSKLHLYGVKLTNKNELIKPHYETEKVIWLKYDEIYLTRPEQRNIIQESITKILVQELNNVLVKWEYNPKLQMKRNV